MIDKINFDNIKSFVNPDIVLDQALGPGPRRKTLLQNKPESIMGNNRVRLLDLRAVPHRANKPDIVLIEQ